MPTTQMTIPPEETEDVNVALVGGAPCDKVGRVAVATSAISCTHTHTQGRGGKKRKAHEQ